MKNNIIEKFRLVLNKESFDKLSKKQLYALDRLLEGTSTERDKELLEGEQEYRLGNLFQRFIDSLDMEDEEDFLLYERLERFKKEQI